MVYNYTKRNLEKCAGVIGTIVSSYALFMLIYAMVVLLLATSSVAAGSAAVNLITSLGAIGAILSGFIGGASMVLLIPIGLVIVNLIFSIMAIKSPVLPNGMVKNRDASRLVLIIFSMLTGNVLVLGLMIAVYCMKDLVKDSNANSVANQNGQAGFDAKIDELKKLKQSGAISEEQYATAINRLTAGLR